MSARPNLVVKPKPVRVYELDNFEKLIKGIKVASCMIMESHQVVDEESVMRRLNALTLNGPSDGNACSSCGVGPFDTRAEQTAHYKHHWHTQNLKRKLFGKTPLTLGQFSSRQEEDMSSSSDEEADENAKKPGNDLFAAATRHCKAFFTNQSGQVFCVYRCILHHRKEELSTTGDGSLWVERCQMLAIPGYQRWAVLMVSGGHFAGAIFTGAVPVVHKTHHSYVTRRGQGQAQVTADQRGNAPRSGGASLRRYCQAQFQQHVQEIVAGWAEDLFGCTFILYRAVGSANQAALFGKNSPLKREDIRVRVLPFPTKKPSYKEVLRVHETVASVEVYESMEQFQKALTSSGRTVNKTSSDSSVQAKKPPKASPNKLDRAKSRERVPRELPTQMLSSEDEGPCYIDSETPAGWIKTLSEQSHNGVITNSRKDLLNDYVIPAPVTPSTESESENLTDRKEVKKKKKKKKPQEGNKEPQVQPKIPLNVKKMWKSIAGSEMTSLETIFEGWESAELEVACNTQDPTDGNTALHKAAIASKPEMVTQILSAGGDPCVRNHQLHTPYAAAGAGARLAFRLFQGLHPDKYNYAKILSAGGDPCVRNHQLHTPYAAAGAGARLAFRLFQGLHPDKYNYAKSHIPGPVTPELLEAEKEKKAQQKRAKRQREKEKAVEKIKTNKFLELPDAQKVKSPESRCFLCGAQLPKHPFEYDRFKFCTIKCLQNHRNLRPLHMSA